MGLLSSKKSTSTTLATTTNTGFSEISDEAVAIAGSGNIINRLDGGAIADAFDFSRAASRDSYDFSRAALRDSMGIAGEIVAQSSALTADVAAKAVQDESDKLQEAFKWSIAAATVIAAAMLLRKGRA